MTESKQGTENPVVIGRLRRAADAGQAEAIFQLAKEELNAGRVEESIRRWKQLAHAQPNNPVPLTGLGVALHMQGRFDEARQCYEQAIRLNPKSVDAHSNLGSVFQGLGQLDDALASYNAALKLQPDHLDAIAGIAAVYDWQGKYADAVALIEPLIAENIQHSELLVTYARVLRRLGRRKEARLMLEDALENYPPPEGFRQRMHFILGALCDDDADYDQAFSHFKTGNILKHVKFDPAAHREAIDDVIRYCFADRLATLASSGSENEQPLFIVGMPRSGTSLVEQILASHSKVYAGGEMQTIGFMVLGLSQYLGIDTPYPQCLEMATSEQLKNIAKIYLDQAAPHEIGPDRITDKMPTNFVHLAFIQMLFPRARIIHCKRNALDTCLSCYVQNFGGAGMRFAYNLEHIGSFYNDYRNLMNHYKDVITLPILDVTYEELVVDQEAQSRAIIDFAGLEWEEECLEFHKLPRSVVTASHAQVRKPMYQSSVSRYRNYESHLDKLKEALGDYAK